MKRLAVLVAVAMLAVLVQAGAARAAAAPRAGCVAAARDDCFILESLTIDGVSAYPLRDMAPLYAAYLARPIGQSDLVRIAQAITDKYRADGYFLSRAIVPPQGPEPKHARLFVYEGYISDIEVTGNAADAVRPRLMELTRRRPLKLAELDRALTLAGDLAGVRLHASLEPILDDPGRQRLVVRTELQRANASLYLDDRGTRALGPDQAYVWGALNSVVRAGDQIGLSAVTTPSHPDQLVYGELAYSTVLGDAAWLRVAASGSRSRPGLTAVEQTLGAKSAALNLRLAYALRRTRKDAVWLAAMFDARHVEQTYANGAGYQDELRVLRGSLNASHSSDGDSSTLFVQVSRGLGGLGASDSKGFERSRYGADARFWKLNAGGSHYSDLGRWAGVYLAADAQWAPQPLLLAEQFAPGGGPYGRAYNYAEISGDSGLAGMLEFRVGWNPKLPPITFFQTYLFVDGAKVWNRRPTFAPRTADLASVGPGVRITLQKRAILTLEAARPLGPAPLETRSHGWRGFAALSVGF